MIRHSVFSMVDFPEPLEPIKAVSYTHLDVYKRQAHELRTPLALMQAQLELFSAEHPDVRPETAEFLTLLREQTERLLSLIHI